VVRLARTLAARSKKMEGVPHQRRVALRAGVRQIELDNYADPNGGLFDQAAGLKLAGVDGWLDDSELKAPGFKVLHVPDIDFNSTCPSLKLCLQTVAAWSDANPGHVPVTIYVELEWQGVEAAIGEANAASVDAFLKQAPAAGPDT
jgi:Phosphoinositide phospholipase C, Ca2+-dependent